MNNIVKYLFHCRVACVLAICCIGNSIAAERPNVLFISLDDMNDWLGCYDGHPDATTPNIDRLAKRAVVFTNAHCVSPICGPSRASVLTGMRPETTNVYHNKGRYIDYVPNAVTFPEHFRANGYRALAAGKVDHGLGEPDPRLWDENGPDCGVLGTPFVGDELHTVKMTPERIIDRGSLKITLPANGGLSAIDRPNNTWDSFDWAPLDCPETDFPDRRIADWGVEQLDQQHDKPFLLALGFYKPHQPFFAPRKYFELYDPEAISLPATIAGDLDDIPRPGRDLATRPWTSGTHKTVVTHGAWRDAVRAYLATVSFADSLVGRVIDALDRSPHADNTWIVLWSDHGWSLGEKDHWGKHVPWRESVRTPLMIVPPRNGVPEGFAGGSRCSARVSLLDLYPTLIAACSLPNRDNLEGKSLLPLIGDPAAEWDDAVVATVGRGTHSVSTDRWRYIRYFDGSEELYDLKDDPREWFNVANKPEHEKLKLQLATHAREDKRFERFVRWGRWKCVFPVEGAPMLFDYQGEFGISEQNDVAADHPEVIAGIRSYIKQNRVSARRVAMPTDNTEDLPSESDSSPVFRAGVNGVGEHQYTNFREPVVVRTKSGRIILGVHAGNRLAWPERSGQDLVVRMSDDEGKTWSDIVVAAEHGDFSCQCHGLVYDAEIDRALFLYTVYNWDYTAVANGRGIKAIQPIYEKLAADGKPFVTSYRVSSDDEGATWSKPVDITGQVGRQAHFGASEGRPITRGEHQGRLLIAGSRMDLDETGNTVAKHPGVWRSDDHGETWTLSLIPMAPEIATPRNASSEARITELADGTLLYNQRTRNTGRHLSWSVDGGQTWAKTVSTTDLKATQCNGCTLTLRDANGKLTNTVLFSIPSPGGRSDGIVYVSKDGGKTWPIRRDVVKGSFAYSALIQLDADQIGLFYEANHYKDIRFVKIPLTNLLE